MTWTLSGRGVMPCWLMSCPTKSSSVTPKRHLLGLMTMPMLVEAVENRSQVFEGVASDEDVVDVYVGEGDTKKNNEFPMTKIVQQICNIGHISLMWVS